jgi:hypothetical protein
MSCFYTPTIFVCYSSLRNTCSLKGFVIWVSTQVFLMFLTFS